MNNIVQLKAHNDVTGEGGEADAAMATPTESSAIEALQAVMSDDDLMDLTPPNAQAPESDLPPDLRLIEALLFASTEPVSRTMLLNRVDGDDIRLDALLDMIQQHYAVRGVNLVKINETYSFRTAPDLAEHLQIVTEPRRKLPRAAAETLAIIAYHQPVTRSEIEAVRGVATSPGTLDILLERGWVRPGKRRETPGRPVTWVTTTDFLSHFNLSSLKDLPGLEELKASGLLNAKPVMASMSAPDETDTTLREHNVTTDTEEEPAHWIAEDEQPPEQVGKPAAQAASAEEADD